MLILELTIVLLLIALNGFLALSELALVSSRPSRLKAMERHGSRGASRALQLIAEPGRFLSAVQVGITLIGIVAGAFSGVTIAERGDAFLESHGVRTAIAEPVAYTVVVAVITYLTVIAGELVPKQIALRHREAIAAFVAGPMLLFTRALGPLITLLDASARLGLRLIGIRERGGESVTDDEIKALVAEAERTGTIKPEERAMISGVMRLADRPVKAIMTPRQSIQGVDLSASAEEVKGLIQGSRHSRLVATEGGQDRPVGVVLVRDVLRRLIEDQPLELGRLLHPVPAIGERMSAVEALHHVENSPVGLAFVVDERGTFLGIVTAHDVVRTVLADILKDADGKPTMIRRRDGGFFIDGSLPIDELAERLSLALPGERDYHTAAGFILHELRRLPRVGDVLRHSGWRFEVADLDGVRIDKILATRLAGRRQSR